MWIQKGDFVKRCSNRRKKHYEQGIAKNMREREVFV